MNAQRNWKLFWWTLPAVVLFLAIGVFLLILWIWSMTAGKAYADTDYRGAVTSYHRQGQVSEIFPEPWKAPYNEGTSSLALAEYDSAIDLLKTALDRVPEAGVSETGSKHPDAPECLVRTNLSLAYEGEADQFRANGDLDGAIASYNLAMDSVGPCSTDGQSLAPTKLADLNEPVQNYQDETEQRQLTKRDATQDEKDSGDDPSSPESSPEQSPEQDPSGGETTSEDPRVQELISINEQAGRGAGSGGGGSGSGGGQGW